jgi:hypothetical protein
MSQEDTKENTAPNEDVSNTSEENSNLKEAGTDSASPENAENIDNLPIESIGSYARLEQLLTEEDSEKTSNPTSQS